MQPLAKPYLNTAPASTPVTLEEVKNYLRIDGSTDDTLLGVMIKAATQRLESLCDRKFVTQTWDIYFDDFAAEPGGGLNDLPEGVYDLPFNYFDKKANKLKLPFGPLTEIEALVTIDQQGTEHEFDPDNYILDTKSPLGAIVLKSGATWPSTDLASVNGVWVKGAEFGQAVEDVPSDIKQAVLSLTAAMYEHRGDDVSMTVKIPAEVALLIEPYRRMKIG